MIYYYCSPLRLRPGSVIEPGNWGRVIRSTYRVGTADHDFRLHREMAYEFGRRIFNPAAPSRMDCFFACPNRAEAEAFRTASNPASVVLAVEPVEPTARTLLTSWASFGSPNGVEFDALEHRIRSYWTDEPTEKLEVLVGGTVRVV